MADKTSAGKLSHRLSFAQRITSDDGYGNPQGDWAEAFVRWARIKPRTGGEAVMAARLQGTQPCTITVRRDSRTVEIQADWRATDLNDGTVYSITAPPADVEEKRAYLDMIGTVGVAA